MYLQVLRASLFAMVRAPFIRRDGKRRLQSTEKSDVSTFHNQNGTFHDIFHLHVKALREALHMLGMSRYASGE